MMACYRKGGCGPYEMLPCGECPASKPEYLKRYDDPKPEPKEKTCKNCGQPAVKEWCEGWPDEVCEHWTPQKPKTHRDMLRSKSDEELAAWFRVIADCEGCPVTENFDECRHGKDCEDKWLEWLRGEAT